MEIIPKSKTLNSIVISKSVSLTFKIFELSFEHKMSMLLMEQWTMN